MKKMHERKVFSILLSIIMIMSLLLAVPPTTTFAAGTSYYVDSVNGLDSNNGLTTNAAWKTLTKVNGKTFVAGDKILFNAGGSWVGQLHPLGSGASGSPITLDMYGTGNKPLINGNGGDSAIYLNGQQYWVINNFEVINDGTTAATRRGIHIDGWNCGTLNHIYISNCTIHNVKGSTDFYTGKNTGGIYMFIGGDTTLSKYNDVLITNNTIYTVDRTGIYLEPSSWATYKCTNFIVQNNTVYDTAGDGIVVMGATSPVIQYNVVHDTHARPGTGGSWAVGMFPFGCDDAVMQYNEAYLCRTTNDGQGYDIDYNNNRATLQYNYSHDNEGGAFLICCDGSNSANYNKDAVVRYNISQNDQGRVFNCGGPVSNVSIYNNTTYIKSTLATSPARTGDWTGTPTTVNFNNNIFYNLGTGIYDIAGTNILFDYNNFYGNHPSNEPADSHKLTANPNLVNPNSGGTGRTTVDGYKLQSSSPNIDAGKTITNNGGKDYWGNTVPYNSGKTDIGAFEYQGFVSNQVLFSSGLETGDTQPTWSDTINASSNVTGYNVGINPECSIKQEIAHTGSSELMYSGTDNSTTSSYCDFKAFSVNIPVSSSTKVSYWIYPQQDNGRYVAVDFVCTDGTTLRDSGAVDQNGYSMHANAGHGGNIPLNQWSQIKCNTLPAGLQGKTISLILVDYDRPALTGQFRGYLDDILITNGTLP